MGSTSTELTEGAETGAMLSDASDGAAGATLEPAATREAACSARRSAARVALLPSGSMASYSMLSAAEPDCGDVSSMARSALQQRSSFVRDARGECCPYTKPSTSHAARRPATEMALPAGTSLTAAARERQCLLRSE